MIKRNSVKELEVFGFAIELYAFVSPCLLKRDKENLQGNNDNLAFERNPNVLLAISVIALVHPK